MNSRTCVGCRGRVDPGPPDAPELCRLAWDDATGSVVLDSRRIAPGRGCWIHPQQGCFEQALKKRAVSRALRRRVDEQQLAALSNLLLA